MNGCWRREKAKLSNLDEGVSEVMSGKGKSGVKARVAQVMAPSIIEAKRIPNLAIIIVISMFATFILITTDFNSINCSQLHQSFTLLLSHGRLDPTPILECMAWRRNSTWQSETRRAVELLKLERIIET